MKVILLADVKGQGKKNDVIEVSDGYGKNFLIPRKLAKVADAQSLNDVKVREEARLYRIETEKKEAKELAEKLKNVKVVFKASSGADGRLYGSVTAKDISDRLEADFGISIDKRKITLPETIKTVGTYQADVKLYTDVAGKLTVSVVQE
ncbi:MAG: 50S ribosomal protein L9 [Ruminococcaceae bacterium]|nr:50S ribosomal protein L9 [Oscillospiraceae bacterium]